MESKYDALVDLLYERRGFVAFTVFDGRVNFDRLRMEERLVAILGEKEADMILVGGLRETRLFNTIVRECAP